MLFELPFPPVAMTVELFSTQVVAVFGLPVREIAANTDQSDLANSAVCEMTASPISVVLE